MAQRHPELAGLCIGASLDDLAMQDAFATRLKPKLARLLQAFGLNILFDRAQGDFLYYRDRDGGEVEVLDAIGGFGASLLGHNHPDIAAAAHEVIAQGRPFNAQASVRGRAALLASRLSELVGAATGRSYVVTLASTGAEAVEAALKHAELERWRRNRALQLHNSRQIMRLRIALRDGTAWLAPDFLAGTADFLEIDPATPLDAALTLLEAATARMLDQPPCFLAMEGGFHGKSTGALQLTHRDEFRRPWNALGIAVSFIGRADARALDAAIVAARRSLAVVKFADDGAAGLERVSVSTIAACFCEPVQGEGGLHVIAPAFMRKLRSAADQEGFPLVLDEIQCGMGRCGDFLASASLDVRGDYYLFSKSLGGGLAKISALLVDDQRYDPEFSYLHTSTFADDDLSSSIALRALDVIERDDVAGRCRQRGDRLRARLGELQRAFPRQIREVRGRGLMIGVELSPQRASPSPLLRLLSEQGLLGYVAAGYLFNAHRVRIAPTLSERAVLRIEPSAYITDQSIEQLYRALAQFCALLADADVAQLTRFIVGGDEVENPPKRQRTADIVHRPVADKAAARVGFLVHFAQPTDLQAWEEGFSAFSENECARFLDRTHGLLEPFVLEERQFRSALGSEVSLTIIGVPFTPAQALASMRQGSHECSELVQRAVEMARERGCSVVGLGGHTSIVTESGRLLVQDELALTTGNSLTVAAALEALRSAARQCNLDWRTCRLGVVGAAGNVGAITAELAADEVRSMVLIGRRGASRLMEPVAARIYGGLFERLRNGDASAPIASRLAQSRAVKSALKHGLERDGSFDRNLFCSVREEWGDDAPIRVVESIDALEECELVVSATNAPSPVIKPKYIGLHPTAICDIAIPRDVDPLVERERPNAIVVRGGVVRAPAGQELAIPALQLRGRELYGCLAETIVLGLVGCNTHYSYGPISAARVKQVSRWAVEHGFEISRT